MTVAQKGLTQDLRKEALRVLAKMLGQRFVFPSIGTAVTELKAAFETFEQEAMKAEKADKEALAILDAIADQSRLIGERQTGKEFGASLGAAYAEIAALRSTL